MSESDKGNKQDEHDSDRGDTGCLDGVIKENLSRK